jgi:hypothetical protein
MAEAILADSLPHRYDPRIEVDRVPGQRTECSPTHTRRNRQREEWIQPLTLGRCEQRRNLIGAERLCRRWSRLRCFDRIRDVTDYKIVPQRPPEQPMHESMNAQDRVRSLAR